MPDYVASLQFTYCWVSEIPATTIFFRQRGSIWSDRNAAIVEIDAHVLHLTLEQTVHGLELEYEQCSIKSVQELEKRKKSRFKMYLVVEITLSNAFFEIRKIT